MYKNVPIQTRGRSIYPSWRSEPSQADVIVKGMPSVLDELEESGPPVELYVDVTNIVSTKLRVPLQYKAVSSDVEIVNIEPAHVTVYANTE
jgi:YbbR domain-containing protein